MTTTATPPGSAATEQHTELVALAQQFAERELEPKAESLDLGDGNVRTEIWKACAELGLDRALNSEGQGGADLDESTFLAILQELASGDGGTAVALLLHNAALEVVVGADLIESETSKLFEKRLALIPPPLAGKTQLKARTLNGKTQLDGNLPFALGAGEAQSAVVFADSEDGGTTLAIVDLGAEGVKPVPQPGQMGLRSAVAAELVFDSCEATAATRPEKAKADALAWDARMLVWRGVAAVARGIAHYAQKKAAAYAEERLQGGVFIAEHDAVRLMLAGMSARSGTAGSGCRSERGRALAEKIASSEAALKTAIDAVQVFGGAGYMTEAGVERAMRDAKYCQLFPEPNLVERLELFKLER